MRIVRALVLGVVVAAVIAWAPAASATPPSTAPLYYVGTLDRYLACGPPSSLAGFPVSGVGAATASAGTVSVTAVVRKATPNVDYPIWVFELDAAGNCLDIPQAGTLTTNAAGRGVGSGTALLAPGTTQVQVVLNPGTCVCANFVTSPIAI